MKTGFTLAELLLAAAVGMILLLVVLQIFGQSARWMGKGVEQAALEREANTALAWMGEDLRLRDQRLGLLRKHAQGDSEFVWVTREAQRQRAGERVLVRYYTAVTDEQHRPSTDLYATRKLYRQQVSLQETLRLLEKEQVLLSIVDSLPVSNPLVDEFLADQIGSLKLRAWVQSSAGELLELESQGEDWQELVSIDLVELECWLLRVAQARQRASENNWASALEEGEGQRFGRRVFNQSF